ncbi:MAG: hypothetical protein M1814_003018 [Vezdaea aestivalis]|nr:MAG: hypothetical protein M1814_003018 [Vezdaea aestivalis]
MSTNNSHASPHLSHLDHSDSAASASASPQPGYAHPYMTAMSQNNFQYPAPPPQHQGSVEPYRASSSAAAAAQNAVSLPPIRLNPQMQGQGQQHPPQMGAPMPPQIGYYTPGVAPTQAHIGITSSPHAQGMGYPLPSDIKTMSGGLHKKEIKRRTKTGCLTCRKRRIKCDEGHPHCRNCQKSKRDCLGYDPMFNRSSQTSGPTAIQPAPDPNSPNSHYPSRTSSYGPAGFNPALSAGNSSPGSSVEPYDYTSAIDPALAGADNAQMLSTNLFEAGKRPVDSKGVSKNGHSNTGSTSKAVEYSLDDLLDNQTVFPTLPQLLSDVEPKVSNELREISLAAFIKEYATPLNTYFSTTWFTNHGITQLKRNPQTLKEYFVMVDVMEPALWSDPGLQSQETKVLVKLMKLCLSPVDNEPGAEAAKEVAKKVSVLETILTGKRLPTNPVAYTPIPADEKMPEPRGAWFWSCLGQLATTDDSTDAGRAQVDKTFKDARDLLDGMEYRDVLYSIAVVRYHSRRRVSPADLQIASGFLRKTATQSGTNQVSTRLTGLAIKCLAVLNGDLVLTTANGSAPESKPSVEPKDES